MRRSDTLALTMLGLLSVSMTARAQSYGPGDSPGRAAYRPDSQWNNGPFYTTPHIDPYAPHGASNVNLYSSEPMAPPYATAPHGLYTTFTPNQGALYPYASGFSPYSGYSSWYARTHGVVPTREGVLQARGAFFRSAPRPPAGVLPPLPPARPLVIAAPASPRGSRTAPAPAKAQAPRETIPVYRSSVAGMR